MLTLYPAVCCRARMACPVKKAALGGCGRADGRTARRQVVPILRAGLVLLEQAMTVLPASETYHVGYVRDETTLQARRTPRCLAGRAAGGSRAWGLVQLCCIRVAPGRRCLQPRALYAASGQTTPSRRSLEVLKATYSGCEYMMWRMLRPHGNT